MIGFRELIILVIFLGITFAVGVVVWRAVMSSLGPAARLARLDELHASGKITSAEYERQRASIISNV